MTSDRNLRRCLLDSGARLVAEEEGAFASATFLLAGLVFQLTSDYGGWRLNIGLEGGTQFPASFWIAALERSEEFPDPPVTEEDLGRMIEVLPRLLDHGSALAERVELLGQKYSRAMKERLE